MLNKNSILKKKEIIEQELEGQIYVIPKNNGIANMENVCCLNGISSKIWKLIDENKNIESIVTSLTDEFDVKYEVVLNDVLEFITNLINENILEVINDE